MKFQVIASILALSVAAPALANNSCEADILSRVAALTCSGTLQVQNGADVVKTVDFKAGQRMKVKSVSVSDETPDVKPITVLSEELDVKSAVVAEGCSKIEVKSVGQKTLEGEVIKIDGTLTIDLSSAKGQMDLNYGGETTHTLPDLLCNVKTK